MTQLPKETQKNGDKQVFLANHLANLDLDNSRQEPEAITATNSDNLTRTTKRQHHSNEN